MKKAFLIGTGCISLALGVVGIVIPLLPTTPFLLLAAVSFVHSSERLHTWLINHRFFGSYIRNYIRHRAISPKAKVFSISLLWISIGYSALFVATVVWLKVVLFFIAVGVTVHIVYLKTLTREMARDDAGHGQ